MVDFLAPMPHSIRSSTYLAPRSIGWKFWCRPKEADVCRLFRLVYVGEAPPVRRFVAACNEKGGAITTRCVATPMPLFRLLFCCSANKKCRPRAGALSLRAALVSPRPALGVALGTALHANRSLCSSVCDSNLIVRGDRHTASLSAV